MGRWDPYSRRELRSRRRAWLLKSKRLLAFVVPGMKVEIGYFGASLEAALENYRLVIEQKTFVYDWDRTRSPDGFAREAETLLLPLSSDGETVDMVLIYQEVDSI